MKVISRIFGKLMLTLVLSLAFVLPLCSEAFAALHSIQAGDTIWKISQKYGTTVANLKKANGLSSDYIYPGQKMYIPETEARSIESGNGSKQTYLYSIQAGDTIWKISQKYGTTVANLKKANGLSSDYIYPGQKMYIPEAGAQTIASRGGLIGQVSATEFDILARIITAEADNQSYQGQVAVGAVVLNRVKSTLFPNTIRGVVYQVDQGGRYQFEPVLNGWINRPASETAKKAALDALNGVDPTAGALFFWESWVKNQYLNARALAAKIGAFTFTY